MDKSEYAVELKHSGYNCCQAVLCALKEEAGMTEEELKPIGAPFCAGMGCLEATCGALIGAEMVLGVKKYKGRPILREAARLFSRFESECGATLCKDLKGRDTGVVLCGCDDCVRNAVRLVLDEISGEAR